MKKSKKIQAKSFISGKLKLWKQVNVSKLLKIVKLINEEAYILVLARQLKVDVVNITTHRFYY